VRKSLTLASGKVRVSIRKTNTAVIGSVVSEEGGKEIFSIRRKGKNREAGSALGEALAKEMGRRKLTAAVFDRSGNAYHGVIQEIAEALRKGGVGI